MKLSSPLPQPLPKECLKAAKIFNSFVDSGNNGLDGVIPRQVLQNAKGFAIFTIIKAGFLFSARAGSGVVIAKLPDGTWSAPSAIGTAGLGVGGQAGAEMTDFLVVLNSRSAVRSFMSAGSLTLGGNMSIALGPLGRNGEALGSLNTSGKVAAMYSYSKTRGLFGGVSVEGSVIVERQDANALAYQSDVSAKQLLSGSVDPPDWAQPLIKTLEACVGMPGGQRWVDDSAQADFNFGGPDGRRNSYAFGTGSGVSSPSSETPPMNRKKNNNSPFPPGSWGRRKSGGSYFNSELDNDDSNTGPLKPQNRTPEKFSNEPQTLQKHDLIDGGSMTDSFPTRFKSDYNYSGFDGSVGQRSNNVHRPTLSLGTERLHNSSYRPGSPFNDLPPFPRMPSGSTASHTRTASSGSFFGANKMENAMPRSSSNPFAAREADPFAYDTPGETIDDLPGSKGALKLGVKPSISSRAGLNEPLSPLDGVGHAIALYEFKAVEPGDLSFKKGEVITITKKSTKTDDWWTGKVGSGNEGIFPANFVEVF